MDWEIVEDRRDLRLDIGERILRLRAIFPNLPAHVLADMVERGEDVYDETVEVSLNGRNPHPID